ncbi:MAG: nucleoside deaminase [Sphingobacteriales bacterium]|nr:MAG: nucleoside deaminase [Sphingobacteriales bacterium]
MEVEKFMQEAVDLSKQAIDQYDGGPFGCVIVKDGKVIGRGWNHVLATCDPTAHAEVMAIRDACKNLKSPELVGCEMYTSSEPCPLCLAAAYWACIGKIYYANTVADSTAVGYEDAIIYEEFRKPMEERKIEMVHLRNADAIKVFDYWREKNSGNADESSATNS